MKKCWLNNKIVVITGASGGLGFSISKLLIEKFNCKIIGICRNEEKVKKSIETLTKKENFTYKIFDVSVLENWQNFYKFLEENSIVPDVLINNAGFMLPFTKIENVSIEEIEEIIKTNLTAYIYSTKILLPLIKKSSTPAIVNIASSAGLNAVIGQSMYCATKFAVKGFTETLIQDYKKQIYIGGVYPGFIKTDILNRQAIKDKESNLINKIMMPLDKATNKIVKSIKRKKKKTIMGIDGWFLGSFGRLFPNFTANTVRFVLKKSKLEMFDGVFKEDK